MTFTLSQASLPAFETGLNALSAVLDKAAAYARDKKVDPSVLLGWRLAPDMFPLVSQVQLACDYAKNGTARLAGIEPPKFEDNESNFDQLKERISKTIAFLKTVDKSAIDAATGSEITFPVGPERRGLAKATDYFNHILLPNFYFHITVAYSLLRHCGVDLGKRDFVGNVPVKVS